MPTQTKIKTLEEAVSAAQNWRAEGIKTVFTNGCFDILHLGHIDYLEKAAALGGKLIVGLNTDESVKRLKGPSRPLQNEYSRARLLAAMQFVDMVVLFGEETPLRLIQALQPDILTKGSDYSVSNIVGADSVIASGGKVCTIDLVEGHSTTFIVDKIKQG